MNQELERHWAPKGKLYVTKDKSAGLYGELLIISPDDPYQASDFVLIDKEDLESYFTSEQEADE